MNTQVCGTGGAEDGVKKSVSTPLPTAWIGADSQKLKKNQEYGSETPVRDLILKEQDRHER